MKKQIYPYIFILAWILSGCQADMPSGDPDDDIKDEMISLSVNAEELIDRDGAITRLTDKGKFAEFNPDDKVGLIIYDNEGNILADNVPFIYDGTNWKFWKENGEDNESKKQIYFDATMSTYIVYYPYDKSVDGMPYSGSKDGFRNYITGLKAFGWEEDQSSEENYRKSDPMMWYCLPDSAIRDIKATLNHIRNSFFIDPKVEWKLTTGDTIIYRPINYLFTLRDDSSLPDVGEQVTGFENFNIYLGDTPIKSYEVEGTENFDKTFHAKDGSYRYIIPNNAADLSWYYYYRGKMYGGERKLEGSGGVRYVVDETIKKGDFSGDNVEAADYYCKQDIGGHSIGYALPWDASDYIDADHVCIGIYIQGYNEKVSDSSDYSATGIKSGKCNGFVLALTDVDYERGKDNKGNQGYITLEWDINETNPINCETEYAIDEYSGFLNQQRIEAKAGSDDVLKTQFKAAHACKNYSTGIFSALSAPENTSGWYLPSAGLLAKAAKVNNANSRCIEKRMAVVKSKLGSGCSYYGRIGLKYNLHSVYPNTGHWSSTEVIPQGGSASAPIRTNANYVNLSTGEVKSFSKYSPLFVRAALSF